jgi:CheY-like chemotaxis protein
MNYRPECSEVAVWVPGVHFPLSFAIDETPFGDKSDAREPRRLEENPAKRPLVLVADDEPIIGETLVEILRQDGFDAVCVGDGAAAVESAKELKPDIVLADVSMPRLNGIEAAKKILQSSPGTRIVLFSGQAETTQLLADARRAGYRFEVLAKPVSPAFLLKKLKNPSPD